MTDVATIRQLLHDFLGELKFKKLVATVPESADDARLRYWQEKVLDDFHAAHPTIRIGVSDLVDACRMYHLHNCDLVSARIPIVDGCVDFAPEFWEERNLYYPNARLPFISTEGRKMAEKYVLVWCCPNVRRDSTGAREIKS